MAVFAGSSEAPPYLVETDGPSSQQRSAYQSISMHPQYTGMSFEELRWAHYSASPQTALPVRNIAPAQSVVPSTPVSQPFTSTAASSLFAPRGSLLQGFPSATSTQPPLFGGVGPSKSLFGGVSAGLPPFSGDRAGQSLFSRPPVGQSLFSRPAEGQSPFAAFAKGQSPVPSGAASQSLRVSSASHYKLDDNMITFVVGTSPQQKFLIHKGVLGTSSEFIRLALRGEWKEATERTIPMPDDDPAVFSVYQSWLYSSKFVTRSEDTTFKVDPEYKLLVQAYILGEKLMDQNFKDSVADALVEKFQEFRHFDTSLAAMKRFDTSLPGLVFSSTPPGSPLRRLWLEFYFNFGAAEWVDSEPNENGTSTEFLVEFSRFSMRRRVGTAPAWRDMMFLSCVFHEHGLEPCYRHSVHSRTAPSSKHHNGNFNGPFDFSQPQQPQETPQQQLPAPTATSTLTNTPNTTPNSSA